MMLLEESEGKGEEKEGCATMRGSISVLPRKILNMFVSDWHYRWFSANIKFNRLGS